MGFNDFWINNNGKKEQLNNTKHGVRKEQLDKKHHSLFDAYDINHDGTLENNELQGIFQYLKGFAGDNVLDSEENKYAQTIFAEQIAVEDADFQGFVKSVSNASDDIVSSETTKGEDGGDIIETKYKDGTIETIYFYPDGEFKMKKLRQDVVNTQVSYSIGTNSDKKYTEKEINELIKKEHSKAVENYKKAAVQATKENGIIAIKPLPLKDYTKMFMDNHVIQHSNTNEFHRRDEQYSPRYIAENLGVDSTTEEGKKIIERFNQLPEEALNQIADGKEMKDLLTSNELTPTFDNLSNVLEIMYGVTLRTEEELKEAEPQREKLITQIKAAEVLTNLYETIAQYNDQYTDNLGLFGLGSEGIGYVLNKLGIDGENHYQWADSCREFAQRASELKVLNPEKFEEGFKKIYGENADKWGIDFNPDAFKKLFAIIDTGKATNEKGEITQEYKDAVLKACNFVADNPNDSTFNTIVNGFGEALVMIMALGWGAEAKGGQVLASTAMGTFNKLGVSIASKQVSNKLLQGALRYSGKAVTLLGPALNEGTKMAAYTLTAGTASNAANRIVKFDSEQNSLEKFIETEAMVVDGAKGSFGFGAFAGVFGSTVTQTVVNRVSKTSSKVISSLSEKFAKGSVDATEVYAKVLEKSLPTKLGECAAFATDVIGFTAFESALAIYNRAGDITAENLADLLWEEFKGQGYSLGQIKIISHLIMWMSGSRSARMNSEKYLKENIPQLKGATVERVNGGKDGYKINLPDGRKIECKNENEMISSLHLMVREQTAFSSRFGSKQDQIVAAGNAHLKNNIIKSIEQKCNTKKTKEALEDIQYHIGGIKDEVILKGISEKLQELESGNFTDGEIQKSLEKVLRLINAYHGAIGDYVTIKFNVMNGLASTKNYEFMKFVKSQNPEMASALAKDPNVKAKPEYKALVKDFEMHCKYGEMIEYLKECDINDPVANHLYNEYYLKNIDFPKRVKESCKAIHEKYGVRIILSSKLSDRTISRETLTAVDNEFSEWTRASNGKAKMPPVLDFLSTKRDYYDEKRAYGQSEAAGYSESHTSGSISIAPMCCNDINMVLNILRHEITHSNDTKLLSEFPEGIITMTDETPSCFNPFTNSYIIGKRMFALDKCKFSEELVKAGVKDPDYAYNNPEEFIARASEGDVSMYSPEMKAFLVEMGMPEWALDMKPLDKRVNDNIKRVEQHQAENPEKTILENNGLITDPYQVNVGCQVGINWTLIINDKYTLDLNSPELVDKINNLKEGETLHIGSCYGNDNTDLGNAGIILRRTNNKLEIHGGRYLEKIEIVEDKSFGLIIEEEDIPIPVLEIEEVVEISEEELQEPVPVLEAEEVVEISEEELQEPIPELE